MLDASIRKRLGPLCLAVDVAVSASPLLVIGPNGAGKTTLLLSILGVIAPDAGRVTLAGQTLYDSATGTDEAPEERRIAYVPQDYALFPHLTAEQNVMFALDCLWPRRSRRERRERARALLARLDAAVIADRRPSDLSGGERQRVALARALATAPRAFLLDEPFAALDAGARTDVRAFLREHLATLGLPSIIVTHDAADAAALGAPIAALEAGSVVQQGTLAELEAKPASLFVEQFCAGGGRRASTPRAPR